jgi:lipoprotein NlpI
MRCIRRLALPILFVALLSAPCLAQSNDNLKLCIDNAQSNPDAALGYCSAAIQSGGLSQENLSVAYYRRGVAYFSKLDYDHSMPDYDQAIRLNPNFSNAYNNRGVVYNEKGNYDRAIQDYDQAIRLNPNYALAFHNRGVAYNHKSEFDRAIPDFDQSIRLNSNYAPAFHNRGNSYFGKVDFDRAIQDYDQAIRLDPKYALAYDNRGLCFKNKGDHVRAIQDYDQAIRLDPKNGVFFLHRGQAQFSLDKIALAQADFTSAVQVQPKNVYPVLWLFIAESKSGTNARGDLEKNAAALDMTKWPSIIAKLYLGTATPESVLAAAKDPDPKKEKSRICEAYFFLAERALLAGNRAEAASLLQKSLDTGAAANFEFGAAKEELLRLK